MCGHFLNHSHCTCGLLPVGMTAKLATTSYVAMVMMTIVMVQIWKSLALQLIFKNCHKVWLKLVYGFFYGGYEVVITPAHTAWE